MGYRFEIAGKKITLSVGFSHKVILEAPADLSVSAHPENAQIIVVSGIDAQRV